MPEDPRFPPQRADAGPPHVPHVKPPAPPFPWRGLLQLLAIGTAIALLLAVVVPAGVWLFRGVTGLLSSLANSGGAGFEDPRFRLAALGMGLIAFVGVVRLLTHRSRR